MEGLYYPYSENKGANQLRSYCTADLRLCFRICKNQLVDLIENTFRREEALYLACNKERAFFASEEHKKYDLWSCQKVTDALIYLLDNIYIRFGSKLYRQNVGIPMGTNCAPPLVADLFLFCYVRDFDCYERDFEVPHKRKTV